MTLERIPATLWMPSMLVLPIPMDLTISGLSEAIRQSRLASCIEPNVLLVSEVDRFPARELLQGSPDNGLVYAVRWDFPDGSWAVGNFAAPTFFVGSPGA